MDMKGTLGMAISIAALWSDACQKVETEPSEFQQLVLALVIIYWLAEA